MWKVKLLTSVSFAFFVMMYKSEPAEIRQCTAFEYNDQWYLHSNLWENAIKLRYYHDHFYYIVQFNICVRYHLKKPNLHYLFFSTLSTLVDRLLTISVKRHASSQLCISAGISYTIKVFNSLMMEREKEFKVFKINSNTFYIASFFYLPNSKFKTYIYM